MNKLFTVTVLAIVLSASSVSIAQTYMQKYYPEKDTAVLRNLHRWHDSKFGLLMHWGIYSEWGIVESWSICSEDEPWEKRNASSYCDYKQKYDNLIKTFDPHHLDPEKWAKAAKYAGMRYVVFTTKHHDGFCMFNTKTTNFKVTGPECPFHTSPDANITKVIFNTFRKDGFMIGAYFSKADWHCPYYWWPYFATPDRNPNYNIQLHPNRWKHFVKYTQTQINELMSNYGRIDILWLDAGWVRIKTPLDIMKEKLAAKYPVYPQSQDIDMPAIVKNARKKQPWLIVVNRDVPGPYQDYLTPENTVPSEALPHPWETCMPMGTSWSYKAHDHYKSVRKLIDILVGIVSKGGNLLLDIGPNGQGQWSPTAYRRLKGIGDWMKVNSQAIYNTHAVAPYKQGKVCLTQLADGTTFAIYLADKGERTPPSRIWMDNICPAKTSKVTLLGYKSTLLKWKKVGDGFEADVPKAFQKHPPCDYAWVLKISRVTGHPKTMDVRY